MFPIGHQLPEKSKERRPVMRLGHMADFVGDNVIDGVDRGLNLRELAKISSALQITQ